MAKRQQSQRGNNQQPTDDDDDDEVEFTPRQLEVINNQVNATVTAIVTRKLKPFQDQLSVLPTIQETLEKLASGGGAAGGQQQGQGSGGQQQQQPGGAGLKLEEHPEFVALKKRDQQREAERQREREEARNSKRDARLTEIATAAGVDKHRVRGVVALLRDQVKFDKDNNPFMTVKRNGLDEEVDLDAGATDFFTSDEGKAYLAPTQQQQQQRGGNQQRGQQQQQQRGGTNAAGVVRGAGQGNNNPMATQQQQRTEKVQAARTNLRENVQALFGDGANIEIG